MGVVVDRSLRGKVALVTGSTHPIAWAARDAGANFLSDIRGTVSLHKSYFNRALIAHRST